MLTECPAGYYKLPDNTCTCKLIIIRQSVKHPAQTARMPLLVQAVQGHLIISTAPLVSQIVPLALGIIITLAKVNSLTAAC